MIAAGPGRRPRRRRDPRQLTFRFGRENARRRAAFARKLAEPPPLIDGPQHIGDLLAHVLRGVL